MDVYVWGVYLSDPKVDCDRLMHRFQTERAARNFATYLNSINSEFCNHKRRNGGRLYFAQHRHLCTAMPPGLDAEMCADAEGRAPKVQPPRHGV